MSEKRLKIIGLLLVKWVIYDTKNNSYLIHVAGETETKKTLHSIF